MIQSKLVSATFLLLFPAFVSQSALAEVNMDSSAQDSAAFDEIIVTGTRIPRRDYQSASPIVTVDSELFEQNGSPSVQTMLNTLPQFTPWATENMNNRTGPVPVGQAIMDLRGLGFGRTLVLLDGKRIVPSNGFGSVDVNLIPAAIVQSVEIVSGGASAVYGSEAIGGVVNFKTRRFTGLEADTSWAQTDVGDGTSWQAGITGGLEFSRGYLYGHLSYAERDAVKHGDRAFTEQARRYDPEPGEFIALGSGSIRQGRIYQEGGNLPTQAAIDDYFMTVDPSYAPGALEPWASLGFNPDGSPFSISPVYNFTGDRNEPLQPVEPTRYSYNFAPDNFLRLPMERINFFGRAGVDLSPNAELFVQLHWASYPSRIQLAPTPFCCVWVGADNPHIHPDLAAILETRPDPTFPLDFDRRMTEVGVRARDADYDAQQVVLGVNGEFGARKDWKFDVYGSFGQVDQARTVFGGVSRTAFEELSMAPDAGASLCGGTGLNPFGIDSISPECAAYIRRTGSETTDMRQTVAEATISGPVLALPAGNAHAVLGILYKQDRFENIGDETLTAQRIDPVWDYVINDVDFGGAAGSQTLLGETRVREAFVEINLPLIADAPLARSLEATFGLRFGDHSNSGTTDAWKAEAIWQVTEPITLRSSYQQAVRAPDFWSLFTPESTVSFDVWADVCDSTWEPEFEGDLLGAQQDPDVAALCVAQGIPEEALASYVDTRGYALGTSGGNADLTEEIAETFTAGLVFRPSWKPVEGLQVSLDYYSIEVRDIVAYLGDPIWPCFDRETNPALDPANVYCQQFNRNPNTYQIDDIQGIPINLAGISVSGYDFQFDMVFDAGPGQLNLHGVASYTESARQDAGVGSPVLEYAGKATSYSILAQTAFFSLVPRVKASADAGYIVGPFDVNLMWRYISDVQDEWIEDFRIPSRQYWDMSLGYSPNDGFLEGLTVRAGITNLTNTDPPMYPSMVEANTEPSTYDVLGRRYFVRMNYRF